MNENIDKESRDHSYEEYVGKMQKLAQDSPTFEVFIEKIKVFKNWYHGQPVSQEFIRWTLADYQKFYEENQ